MIYIENQPLEWKDFKGKPDQDSTQDAFAFITLVATGRKNFWSGNDYLETHGVMYQNLSWVKPEAKSENKLKYFRTYHKIAELYARKLYVIIDSLDTGRIPVHKECFENTNTQFENCIIKFNNETNFGNDSTALKIWIDKINTEFNNYPSNGSNKSFEMF